MSLFERAVSSKALPEPRADAPNLYATPTSRQRLANKAASRHTAAYGGEDAIDWVMDCVELYSQTASNARLHFERSGRPVRTPGEPDRFPEARGAAPEELADLFRQPNGAMDWTELIELSVIDLLLAGEFFWYKHKVNGLGQPDELYRISPALIDIDPGKIAPRQYIYNAPGGGEPIKFQPKEILHVKRPNPHDPWRGLGVIAGGPRMYDIDLAMTDAAASYYEQGTRLSGILETERSIPDKTWQKIIRQFNGLYSGRRNAGKVAMLERGLRFRSISASAAQAEYVKMGEWSRDRIAAAFKVPIPLLGMVGNADRQAVREAQRIFDEKIIRPFLNRLQSLISFGLTQAWGLDLVIEHDYVMPMEDKLDLAQSMAALPGVRVREVRELIDLKPLADEDPALEWIDDAILNLPGQEAGDDGQGGHADRPLADEPGRPPKGKNTVLFPRKPGDLPPTANVATATTTEKAIAAAKLALNGHGENSEG